MSLLGYAYLHAHLKLTAFEPASYARLGAVTRVTATATANGLLVPAQVAGKTQTLLDHVLFALKHEGVNLQVLADCSKQRTRAKRYKNLRNYFYKFIST